MKSISRGAFESEDKSCKLYGKKDLKLEEFQLPAIEDDEILLRVISNTICMSSYKAVIHGEDHKRIPDNVAEEPIIVGHEFSGEIVEVGDKWRDQFNPGKRFSVQLKIVYKGEVVDPGCSYQYFGGNTTYIVIPREVMKVGCLRLTKERHFFRFHWQSHYPVS